MWWEHFPTRISLESLLSWNGCFQNRGIKIIKEGTPQAFSFSSYFSFYFYAPAQLSIFRIAWNSKPTTHLSLRRPVENHWLSATKNCRDPLWNNLFCYGATFLCPYLFWSECVWFFLSTIKKFGCRLFRWKNSSGWLQCCSENWKEQLLSVYM